MGLVERGRMAGALVTWEIKKGVFAPLDPC